MWRELVTSLERVGNDWLPEGIRVWGSDYSFSWRLWFFTKQHWSASVFPGIQGRNQCKWVDPGRDATCHYGKHLKCFHHRRSGNRQQPSVASDPSVSSRRNRCERIHETVGVPGPSMATRPITAPGTTCLLAVRRHSIPEGSPPEPGEAQSGFLRRYQTGGFNAGRSVGPFKIGTEIREVWEGPLRDHAKGGRSQWVVRCSPRDSIRRFDFNGCNTGRYESIYPPSQFDITSWRSQTNHCGIKRCLEVWSSDFITATAGFEILQWGSGVVENHGKENLWCTDGWRRRRKRISTWVDRIGISHSWTAWRSTSGLVCTRRRSWRSSHLPVRGHGDWNVAGRQRDRCGPQRLCGCPQPPFDQGQVERLLGKLKSPQRQGQVEEGIQRQQFSSSTIPRTKNSRKHM